MVGIFFFRKKPQFKYTYNTNIIILPTAVTRECQRTTHTGKMNRLLQLPLGFDVCDENDSTIIKMKTECYLTYE